MKKSFQLLLIIFSASNAIAQNTFPTNAPVTLDSNLILKAKFKVGIGINALTMKYVPGTATFPAMFKFSAPGGGRPVNRLEAILMGE